MYKIDKEVAEAEFDRFVEAADLDLDMSEMDSEDKTALTKQKNRIIRAIQQGHLVVNDEGEFEYTPFNKLSKSTDTIIFHERSGTSLMAMDGKKKGAEVAKTYAVMANMCKVHQSIFAGLFGSDIKTCEAIFALLMD